MPSSPSRPGSSPDTTQSTSVHAPSSSRASVPPSEPRSSRASLSSLDAAVERPARLQMIVALMLGLVLVAIPLYLWRRPRADSIAVTRSGGDAASPQAMTMTPPETARADPRPTLSEPRVLACQDPGPKKTPAERCDHLVDLEKAFAKAIEDSFACVPKDASGTIQYVADVSFKRRTIGVFAPKGGRSIRSSKVASGCASAVKKKLYAVVLDGMPHEHARYKIAITATYPAAGKP